jgi:hypothetical protein
MLTHTLTDPQGKKINITEEQALSYNQGNNRLAKGFQVTPIETARPTSPIVTPVPAKSLKPAPEVQLPTPQAPQDNLVYAETVKGAVDSARKTLDTTLANEKSTIDTQVDTLRKQQADTLAKAKPLTEPFRAELENTERRKKFVDDNFEANQRLTNELDSLLTQQNALMAQAMGGAIMSNRARQIKVNRTQQEVSARVGVIEAVMNARNNQIAQAYTAIDRSIGNIASDRNDSLNYYNTLIELDNQRILTLDNESRKITNEQISLVKGDLAKAEKTAEYVKELMLDPTTAQFMADAGVTLLDSVDEVKTKMAEQGKRQEIVDAKNRLVEAGYEIVAYPSDNSFPVEVGGKTLYAKVRPGSPLDLDIRKQQMAMAQMAQELASSQAVTPNSTIVGLADKLDFLIDTANDAMQYAHASGTSELMRELGDKFIGDTDYNQLVALTNTLKTNALTLMSDPDIKKFFGPQMSNADVTLMTAAGTTLNPEKQTPDLMRKEISRINDLLNRMKASLPENVAMPAPIGENEQEVAFDSIMNASDGNYVGNLWKALMGK